MLGELHVALLKSIIKDIEDVARTPSVALGVNPGGGHPQIVEGVCVCRYPESSDCSFRLFVVCMRFIYFNPFYRHILGDSIYVTGSATSIFLPGLKFYGSLLYLLVLDLN